MSKVDKEKAEALDPTKYVTAELEKLLSIVVQVPMDDPSDPNCRMGAPTLIWGPPGIGKSGRVDNVGLRLGLGTATVYLSTHQPEDISGVFMSDGKGGAITVCPLPQVNYLVSQQRGILFLDELSNARPAMQGAGLSVVHERFWAGMRLPGGIRVIAAANPVDVAAGGWNLTPPMANRFLHLHVNAPSINDWSTWLLSGDQSTLQPALASEQLVREKWDVTWAKVRALGAGFMKHRQTNTDGTSTLYSLPKAGPIDRGRAWASPRSWEVALRCVATAEILGEKELGVDLLAASVGAGMAGPWMAWVADANLPDPEVMLKNGWEPDRRRLDIAFAAYSSAVSFALSKKDKAEQRRYAVLAWKLLQTPALEMGLADVALAPAAALMRGGYSMSAGADIAAVAEPIIFKFGTSGLSQLAGKP